MLNLHKHRGVTLVELIIGLVIVSFLLALGAPMVTEWIQNAQVRSTADSIQNGLQKARTEAVRRNVQVRFQLTEASGAAAWTVGCVGVNANCPEVIDSRAAAEAGGNARVGASVEEPPPSPIPADQYSAALAAGAELPGEVTFNGLGSVVNVGTDMTRIDVTHARADDARRLVILINSGGAIRLCDPALTLADNPQGCS